jgi:hypothetical protein
MADLKTNYVDDVLDTTKNQLRKYQQIQNDDGTVSFVDVTEYTQVGTSFGAKDINDTNAAINDVNGKLPQLKVLKIPLGVKTTLNPGIFSLLFPTKKEGYTPIAIKSWALFNRDGADNIHINGVVTDQNVSIEGKISGSNQIIIPSDAFVEVLYLVN